MTKPLPPQLAPKETRKRKPARNSVDHASADLAAAITVLDKAKANLANKPDDDQLKKQLAEANAAVVTLTEAKSKATDALEAAETESGTATAAAKSAAAAKVKAEAARNAAKEELRASQQSMEHAQRVVDDMASEKGSLEAEQVVRDAAVTAAGEMVKLLAGSGGAVNALRVQGEPKPLEDQDLLRLARLVWLGSLSSSDLASIGMLQTLEPLKFRKLVLWATASSIDLREYAGEVDSVLDQVTSIAEAARQRSKETANADRRRMDALKKLAEKIAPDQAEAIKKLLDAAGSSSEPTKETGQ